MMLGYLAHTPRLVIDVCYQVLSERMPAIESLSSSSLEETAHPHPHPGYPAVAVAVTVIAVQVIHASRETSVRYINWTQDCRIVRFLLLQIQSIHKNQELSQNLAVLVYNSMTFT